MSEQTAGLVIVWIFLIYPMIADSDHIIAKIYRRTLFALVLFFVFPPASFYFIYQAIKGRFDE